MDGSKRLYCFCRKAVSSFRKLISAAPGAYFFWLFIAFFVDFFYFGIALKGDALSLLFKFVSAVADAGLLTLLCMFLRGKWKNLSILFLFIISAILITNLLYFRNFADILPASLYFGGNLEDSTILDSAFYWMKLPDIILIACPVALGVFVLVAHKKKFTLRNAGRRQWIVMSVVTFLAWVMTFLGSYRRTKIYFSTESFKETIDLLFEKHSTSWLSYYNNFNFSGYLTKCISRIGSLHIKLTEEDKTYIKDYFEKKSQLRTHFPVSDSIRVPENVVFIIVESLPWVALEKDYSADVAPTLTAMKNDSTAIVLRSKVLAGYGRSSDAQFMYQTGLLPLRDEPLVTNYSNNFYPGLARALPGSSLMLTGGVYKSLWSQSTMQGSYGFKKYIPEVGLGKSNLDRIILRRAISEIDSLQQPFYLLVLTNSMHNPYKVPRVTHDSKLRLTNVADERDREYLQRMHHFDTALKEFIAGLKKKGIYDNTLIVIAGDHEIAQQDISQELRDSYVPVIILNSPRYNVATGEINQVDVYPTLLDILGVRYEFMGADYSGVGMSAFNAAPRRALSPYDEEYDVSEMIIKRK